MNSCYPSLSPKTYSQFFLFILGSIKSSYLGPVKRKERKKSKKLKEKKKKTSVKKSKKSFNVLRRKILNRGHQSQI